MVEQTQPHPKDKTFAQKLSEYLANKASNIGHGIVSAATLPHDVMYGAPDPKTGQPVPVDLNSDDGFNRAMTLSGMAVTGGAPSTFMAGRAAAQEGKALVGAGGAPPLPNRFAEGAADASRGYSGEGIVHPSGMAEGVELANKPYSHVGEGIVQPSGIAEGVELANPGYAANAETFHAPAQRGVVPAGQSQFGLPSVGLAREVTSTPGAAAAAGERGGLPAVQNQGNPLTPAAGRETLPPPRVVGGEAAGESGGPFYGNFRTNETLPETLGGPRSASSVALRTALGVTAGGGLLAGSRVTPAWGPGIAVAQDAPPAQSGPVGVPDQQPRAVPDRIPVPVPRPALVGRAGNGPSPQPVAPSRDFQSNSRGVINPDNSINWGSGDSAADFVRADKARMAALAAGQDPSGTNDFARGGSVSDDQIRHAINVLQSHLNGRR